MASQKLSVFSISVKPGISWHSLIDNLLSMARNGEHYFITEQSQDYIGGCYILLSKHNQFQYNVSEQRFESVLIERQHVLRFDIFIHGGLMMVWGGSKISSLFVTAFTQASNNLAIIENRETNFKEMVKRLLICTDVQFIRMKLHNVVIEDGIVANCSVTLDGREDINHLIEKYMDQISQITLKIVSGEDPTSVVIYSSGTIIIFKDRDNIPDQVIDRISSIVGGGL